MIESNDIACLIFAAGASSRFGGPKMRHKLDDGNRILAKTMGVYAQVFEQVNVVVRAGDHALISLVEELGGVCILNSRFEDGLSQSIIAGVKNCGPARAWLLALGDMPYVSAKTVEGLVEQATSESIVVPRTSAGNGNPIIFGTKFSPELLALTGDLGAKPVVMRHPDCVQFYDCKDTGVHHDIDQLSDILPVEMKPV